MRLLLLFITFSLTAMDGIEQGPSHFSPNGFSGSKADIGHNVIILPLELRERIIRLENFCFPRALRLQAEKEGRRRDPCEAIPFEKKAFADTCAVGELEVRLDQNTLKAVLLGAPHQKFRWNRIQRLSGKQLSEFMPKAFAAQLSYIHKVECHSANLNQNLLVSPDRMRWFECTTKGQRFMTEYLGFRRDLMHKARIEAVASLREAIAPLTPREFLRAYGIESLGSLYGRLSTEAIQKNFPALGSCKLCDAKIH